MIKYLFCCRNRSNYPITVRRLWMTLADLEGSVIEAKVYARIDWLLINTDWQPFETGRSRIATDIDPVPFLHESCHQSPSWPQSTTKAFGAKCAHIDRRVHVHSIARALNLVEKLHHFCSSVTNSPLWFDWSRADERLSRLNIYSLLLKVTKWKIFFLF